MELIVDLHVHSHFSRATSRDCTVEGLYRWGKLKGINIIGTGDFTHLGWLSEIQTKLRPAEPGLFELKPEYRQPIDTALPPACREAVLRFVPSVEISTIYSKDGAVRKLHQLIIMPSLAGVTKLNERLSRIGNLRADGRPILGLDSKELLRLSLDSDPRSLFIPAHIWTPWFGLFGSKSGFDSLQAAFEDLTRHIHAVETGLSSDPYMNWRQSQLDGVTIISNSDAHSPGKLGREASVLATELTYGDMYEAITTGDERFKGTIEFFPEEGKYHYDGHRVCGVRLSPAETRRLNGLCPKCGKPVVVGVDYRVEQLADRPADFVPPSAKTVEYIIPLTEILAELRGTKRDTSKAVQEEYLKIGQRLGAEFTVLRRTPIEAIEQAGWAQLAHAIDRLRRREVVREPGYDGVYGVISLLKGEIDQASNHQTALL